MRWQLEEVIVDLVVIVVGSSAGHDVVIGVDRVEHIDRDINRHEHVAVRQRLDLGRSRGVDAAQRKSGRHA